MHANHKHETIKQDHKKTTNSPKSNRDHKQDLENEFYDVQNSYSNFENLSTAYVFGEDVLKFVQKIENAHEEDVNYVTWHPKQDLLATAGDDHMVRIWCLRNDELDYVSDYTEGSESKNEDNLLNKKLSKLGTDDKNETELIINKSNKDNL